MSNICGDCGKDMNLVGKAHRCIVVSPAELRGAPRVVTAPPKKSRGPAAPVSKTAPPSDGLSRLQRWRAANRDRYNAFMRDYMKRKRAKA